MCWDNIPAIPSYRRSQFYIRQDDGAYNYGYDSGDGIAANQRSSADNQVEGFYTSVNTDGKPVIIRYTAGVRGFRPETIPAEPPVNDSWDTPSLDNNEESFRNQAPNQLEVTDQQLSPPLRELQNQEDSNVNSDANGKPTNLKHLTGLQGNQPENLVNDQAYLNLQPTPWDSARAVQHQASFRNQAPNQPDQELSPPHAVSGNHENSKNNSDASYEISYNTGEHAREEISDKDANIKGKYLYTDEVGEHDLSYIAGPNIGFKVTSESPNSAASTEPSFHQSSNVNADSNIPSNNRWKNSQQRLSDRSFELLYNTGNHARTESSDQSGNNHETSSYSDEAVYHDLSNVAGDDSRLSSKPSRLNSESIISKAQQNSWSGAPIQTQPSQNQESSDYSFAYQTDHQSRKESGDASGRVIGSYIVKIDGGHQEVNFNTGFGDNRENQDTNSEIMQVTTPVANEFNMNQQTNLQNSLQNSFNKWSSSWENLNLPRFFNTDKSVHPTYTVITPADNQASFEYGPRNAVILTYLPPDHPQRHGYIYDTQH